MTGISKSDQLSAISNQLSANRYQPTTINYQLSTIADGISNSGRCGWWIDIGVEPLAAALREAMSLSDEERYVMGANGRKLVAAKYCWPSIAEQMRTAYHWMLNGGTPPGAIQLG